MDNAVSGTNIENVVKYKNVNLLTIERRRNYYVAESNFYTTKFFTENLLAIEILMIKPAYLVLLMLDLSKTIMYEFWYDYIKPK